MATAKVQQYSCKYCGKAFQREKTLSAHMCVKKRRHMEIDTMASRFGFIAYKRFYEITMSSKKPKTTQDFIESPYYIDFVKFGNHISNLKPIYPEQFVEFVIKNSVKLKDWTKDFVFETYIDDLIKKEPAVAATERSITEIMTWSELNNVDFNEFFRQISANEASHLIRTGKISPWILYLCNSAGDLMGRFNQDHAKIIGSIIDAGFWIKRFKKNSDDVDFIKNMLQQAGL
jgi:hypothetical protein